MPDTQFQEVPSVGSIRIRSRVMAALPRVAVVGGGIGGVCTALALRATGFRVRLFERSDRLRELGAGLALQPNALEAMRRVLPAHLTAVRDIGIECGSLGLYRSDGSVMAERSGSRFGFPVTMVHRAELLQVLMRDLDTDAVALGHRLSSFTEEQDKLVLEFSNGHRETTDILVGADGLHSAVRQQLHPSESDPLINANTLCWRGVAPVSPTKLRLGSGFGYGRSTGVLPLTQDRTYWWATRKGLQLPLRLSPKTAASEEFLEWSDEFQSLIDSTADSSIFVSETHHRNPLSRWGSGRVTLVGDAAHPILPTLGQGACQAIEDAVSLALRLSELTKVGPEQQKLASEVILREFEKRRASKTEWLSKTSTKLWEYMHVEGHFKVKASYMLLSMSKTQSPFATYEEKAFVPML